VKILEKKLIEYFTEKNTWKVYCKQENNIQINKLKKGLVSSGFEQGYLADFCDHGNITS